MGIIALFKKGNKLSPNNDYNTNNIRFTKYHAFIFLLYSFINQRYSNLGYYLFIKMRF